MGNVTITGTTARNQLNDSEISVTNMEICVDGAINLLNTYGAGLSNLTGAAGSKTGTYTSAQGGAIMTMTQQIYSKHFKHATQTNVNVGSVGLSYVSDTQLLTFASKLTVAMKTQTNDPPIYLSNDPVPT
jgi:hypothetical protein